MGLDEFAKTLILGLPNLLGLVYAVYILKMQNDKLIDLLGKVVNDCVDKEGEEKSPTL